LADPTAKEDWSSGNNKSIPSGARFFLVKQGELPRGIIGSGRTTSATQQGPHWDDSGRQRNFNDLSFDVLLDSRSNGLLSVDHLQDLSTTLWSNASSGIGIPLEIAQELELRWDSFLQGIGQVTDLSLEMPDISSLPGTEEGKQVLVRHLIRERDPRIVRQKKASVIHATGGLACEICGFDFYAVYGDLGREFCECHHRLALNNGERTTRLEDLAILCANCHRMIHRRVPMLNTDKLREIVERQTDG
jgi:5-methylcytosine-specific restriction endonuclease McrA